MDDFLKRQLSLIRQVVVDYRSGLLGLNELVHRVEALGSVIGGKLWEEQLFEVVLDLERVNSEAIDKRRHLTQAEHERVAEILRQLDAIAVGDGFDPDSELV
ncbi:MULTISPECIES: hypothetical protein [unclassified Variovorax]|nr:MULTISPECIES: hypothetical protein [unclassified Variovorax]KWT97545.1 hypothetical protein APY03_1475 [Variovorax sp. WDL1]PNG51623.1 hypothetical protein CHC06_05204 [Variovorax sp. B2]PNG54351.1 hypothetical protein CHC07_04180 [Variovorax sp. B4]VTV11846.1 hypothetical protein WDL1CHR_02699 [Variovorax sp. WDL1]